MCLLIGPGSAEAQEPLRDNAFVVDASTGPVMGATRIVGLAGAYTALAHGSEAAGINPASFGVRPLWERDFFEWDATYSLAFPMSFSLDDYFNNGLDREDGFRRLVFVDGGLGFRIANFGMGALSQARFFRNGQIRLRSNPVRDTRKIDLVVWDNHVGIAAGFADNQVVVGAGARLTSFRTFESAFGWGPELGVAVGVEGRPWRLGFALRMPVRASFGPTALSAADMDGIYLPQRFQLPWETSVGVAVQVGERRMHWAWSPEDQRRDTAYRHEPRRYLLLTADLVIVGRVTDGIGVDAFVDQQLRPSGEHPSFSLRAGAETELWRNVLKIRGGSYIEAPRSTGAYRLHATAGLDLRVARFYMTGFILPTQLRLSAAFDAASGYFNWSITAGFWY